MSMAAHENRDSLRKVIQTTTNDTAKIASLCALACDMTMFSPDSVNLAIIMTTRAIELAQSKKIPSEKMRGYYDRGWMHYVQGDFTRSEEDYQSAILLAESLGKYRDYHNFRDAMSSLYFEMGRKDEALEIKYESLAYFRETGDSLRVMSSLSGFIHGYLVNAEFEKARTLLDNWLMDMKLQFLLKRMEI